MGDSRSLGYGSYRGRLDFPFAYIVSYKSMI